jgi:hypothetical protein
LKNFTAPVDNVRWLWFPGRPGWLAPVLIPRPRCAHVNRSHDPTAQRSGALGLPAAALGDTLDTSKVEASYGRGVLTVTIPVAETAQPRKVAIAGTEGKPEAIQAESTEATASATPN